ncbi:MAG: 6-bladed beta-propeller [Bacteroidales bacterium]|nr:6-bladed beta-propeller [Bacteroidales bacterium]
MKKIIPILLLCLILFSCSSSINNKSNENIDIINLTDLKNVFHWDSLPFDSVKVIKLETSTDDSYIDFGRVLFGKHCIYVTERKQSGTVAIFDINGKFLKKLNKGNGPGEISYAYAVDFDNETNQLVVLQDNKIIKYDEYGNFIEDKQIISPSIDFTCIPDGYLFYSLGTLFNSESPLYQKAIIRTDKDCYIISTDIYDDNNRLKFSADYRLFQKINDGEVLISIPYNDTIFIYKNNTITPYAFLDYTPTKLDISNHNTLQSFEELVSSSTKNYYNGGYLETNNFKYVFLQKCGSSDSEGYFIDKNSNEIYDDYIFVPMDEFPTLGIPLTVYQNYFVYLINPVDDLVVSEFLSKRGIPYSSKITKTKYLTQEQIDILNNVEDEDNPILFLVKFKNSI